MYRLGSVAVPSSVAAGWVADVKEHKLNVTDRDPGTNAAF
jgi:hypothetical protein